MKQQKPILPVSDFFPIFGKVF